MNFYKDIQKIFPYLKSVRKLKTYLSFDVEFSDKWKIPKKFINTDKTVELEKLNPGTKLISFVSDFNEEEINQTISNLNSIIDFNRELEEKEVLFVNKVEELKKIFEKQNLGKLQNLKFDLNDLNLNLSDEEQTDTNTVAPERD